jgi:hypothetical protein
MFWENRFPPNGRCISSWFASIAVVRLWTESVEAMRGETRDVVAQALPIVREWLGGGVVPLDKDERVARERKMIEQIYAPFPDAIDVTIAGVPCNGGVHRPRHLDTVTAFGYCSWRS